MSRVLVAATIVALATLATGTAQAQLYRRPFSCSSCIANWYYFDQDPSGGVDDDWSCSGSSYDGHRGTDFSLAGGLAAIDAGYDVVAAQAGTVVSVLDGNFDRCQACGGTGCGTSFGFGFGNHVVINHGSNRVVYAHMRNGSIRVAPGDTVTCGQVIGQIASSGCSTGAHLHFETRPLGGASATAFDPFAGACSPTTPSRWASQGPHRGIPGPTCELIVETDAGHAATPSLDAATGDDASIMRRDAGLDGDRSGGCSCNAPSRPGPPWWLALTVIGAAVARRRQRARRAAPRPSGSTRCRRAARSRCAR